MGTTRRNRDERLPGGSIVYWSRRFKDSMGAWRVPIRCGSCGEERTINVSNVYARNFSGLCHRCGNATRLVKTDRVLSSGSTVYWSRRFKHKGNEHVPVCCGNCGQERIVSTSRARKKDFTGLCLSCRQILKTNDETLPNGSIVHWSRRFKNRKGVWRVPVRCGNCGEERVIDASSPCHEDFSGLCIHCRQTPRTRIEDEILPNGSIIYWSRCFKHKDNRRVPVRCGSCGKERTINTSNIYSEEFSGLCLHCSSKAKRKHTKTGTEVLPSGSVIYWDDEIRKGRRQRAVRVRCGGPCCDGYTRYVPIARIQEEGFTGFCNRCCRYGPSAIRWKGGRRITSDGYISVWLPLDHPFRCMASENGHCSEHRLVKAQQLGRPLTRDEIVHHINGKRQDNRPENLRLYIRDSSYTGPTHHAGYRPAEPKPSANKLLAFLNKLLYHLWGV